MRTRTVGALTAIALLPIGCGSGTAYHNASRPPAPINVSVNLTDERVLVSPARIGAGPIVLLVANESGTSHDLTLTSPGGGAGSCVPASASSGPINPQGVARLPVEVTEGECVVGVRDAALRPAHLRVGRRRASAQDALLQP